MLTTRDARAADLAAIVRLLADDENGRLTSTGSRIRAHAFSERLGFLKSHAGMKLHLRGSEG